MNESKRPFSPHSWVGWGKPSGKILGEIITWKIQGGSVCHADLVAGLKKSDLDADVARELAPRNAFNYLTLDLLFSFFSGDSTNTKSVVGGSFFLKEQSQWGKKIDTDFT